jgi:hypothetical protein
MALDFFGSVSINGMCHLIGISVTLQPSSAVFLICKRGKIPFAKESRSHDTARAIIPSIFISSFPPKMWKLKKHMHKKSAYPVTVNRYEI